MAIRSQVTSMPYKHLFIFWPLMGIIQKIGNTKPFSRILPAIRGTNINIWVLFYVSIYVVLVHKLITLREIDNNVFFSIYSLVVSFYILSRFLLAYFYDPADRQKYSRKPTVTFGIPSKNEGENIRETIMRIANSKYPKNKFDIIAVNDGSTDNTLKEMLAAQKIAAKKGIKVTIVNWRINRGKRHGMAECVKRSDHDIMVFIDSDSFVENNTATELVKYFSNPKVAAVAGHTYVTNSEKNLLTKMQAVRYFVAFKAYKASEALFGSVTCCSGCCSAYRRKYLLEVLKVWQNQTFLGVKCTYGDDRSLTNFLLQRGYDAVFSPTAIAQTFVPETLRQFIRQQMRWKKSWVRESLIAGTFIWKRNPLMSISFYISVILPLLAPVVVLRALVWYPMSAQKAPFFYLFGLALMAIVYGLYYRLYVKDNKWIYGVLFGAFYTLVLIWQLPWAILNIRDPRWGTR